MNEAGAETYDAVVDALETWNPYHAEVGLSQMARQYLGQTLDGRRRITRGHGGLAVDLVVDDTVAVVFLESPNAYSGQQVAAQLKAIGERFPYLVVYWWNNSSFDSNSHRTLNRRYTASKLGVRGLTHISRDTTPATPRESILRQLLTRSGFFALVSLFSAVTIAVGVSVSALETTLTRGLFVLTGMVFVFSTSMAAALAID